MNPIVDIIQQKSSGAAEPSRGFKQTLVAAMGRAYAN